MAHTAEDSDGYVRQVVGDIPEFKRKLRLTCGACERNGDYRVGRVIIDPDWFEKNRPADHPFEEYVSFSGVFRCKRCGAGGPWEIPGSTQTWLLLALVANAIIRRQSGILIGRLQLFDGTVTRSGAESEDYLKKKIEENPQDAFLWGRLGNLYDHAGLEKQAHAAYEKGAELDEKEIESNYHLGRYRQWEGDLYGAAECFQRVIRHAGTDTRCQPELRKNIVRDSLECLFDLHCETEGEEGVPFPPEIPTVKLEPGDEPQVISLLQMDLESDEDWEILTSLCLTGRVPEDSCRREANRQGPDEHGILLRESDLDSLTGLSETIGAEAHEMSTRTIRGKRRVSRNAPCPCGSGKKYKRCCGRN